jgi:hypothetical protein
MAFRRQHFQKHFVELLQQLQNESLHFLELQRRIFSNFRKVLRIFPRFLSVFPIHNQKQKIVLKQPSLSDMQVFFDFSFEHSSIILSTISLLRSSSYSLVIVSVGLLSRLLSSSVSRSSSRNRRCWFLSVVCRSSSQR